MSGHQPTGVWIGASYVLGRPVPVNEPYPHICGASVTGRITGRSVTLRHGVRDGYADCAACAHQQAEQTNTTTRREVTS
jgi:hypothetical protein